MQIDGEYLSHLRLADDISICANIPHELQQILQELPDEREIQGLKMNMSKKKATMENNTPMYVNNTQIENAESYIYMGYIYTAPETKTKTRILKKESKPDGQHSHRDIFKGNIGICLKRQVQLLGTSNNDKWSSNGVS